MSYGLGSVLVSLATRNAARTGGQAVAEYALVVAIAAVVAIAGFLLIDSGLDLWQRVMEAHLSTPTPGG